MPLILRSTGYGTTRVPAGPAVGGEQHCRGLDGELRPGVRSRRRTGTRWRRPPCTRSLAVPEVCGFQVDPLVVATIVPLSPTAKQWVLSVHETPLRLFAVPEVCGFQVEPVGGGQDRAAVADREAVGAVGARDPVESAAWCPRSAGSRSTRRWWPGSCRCRRPRSSGCVSVHETPKRSLVVPEVCGVQVDPSVVTTIIPASADRDAVGGADAAETSHDAPGRGLRECLGRPGRSAVGGRHDPRSNVAVHQVHHAAAGEAHADRRAADGVEAVLGRRQRG